MSDILRLIAGGLLALICCYVGILIKRRYKEREKYYTRALAFASTLASEISLHKTPVPDIAKKFVRDEKGEFEKTVEESMRLLSSGDGEKIADSIGGNILKADEKTEIASFFCGLGKTTVEDQIAMIHGYEKMFDDKKTKCAKESKQLGTMYFKLCVLLGLALILILA